MTCLLKNLDAHLQRQEIYVIKWQLLLEPPHPPLKFYGNLQITGTILDCNCIGPDWSREQSKSVIASMADAPTFHSSICFTAKDSNKGFSYHEIFNWTDVFVKICISPSDLFCSSNLSIQCNNVIVIWVDQNKFPSVFTLSASRNHLRTSNWEDYFDAAKGNKDLPLFRNAKKDFW